LLKCYIIFTEPKHESPINTAKRRQQSEDRANRVSKKQRKELVNEVLHQSCEVPQLTEPSSHADIGTQTNPVNGKNRFLYSLNSECILVLAFQQEL
jgi:hypothetical protein